MPVEDWNGLERNLPRILASWGLQRTRWPSKPPPELTLCVTLNITGGRFWRAHPLRRDGRRWRPDL